MPSGLAKLNTASKRVGPCVATTKAGSLCKHKAQVGSTVCASHKTKAQIASSQKTSKFTGIYARSISGSRKLIADQVMEEGEFEGLKSTDIEQELALGRIELAMMLDSDEYSAKQHFKAIETISKVAVLAKRLKEMDNTAIRHEFVEAVINAVTFAFHRANAISDPAERSTIFMREFQAFFPDVEGDIVDTKVTVLDGPDES